METLEIKNAVQLSEDRFLKIVHDSHYTSMDDDGQLATIVYKGGSRTNLGDKPNRYDRDCNNHEEAFNAYFKGEYGFSPSQIEKNVISLPVYAYVHSGATISTDSSIATCPWDSGMSGFVYVLKSKIKKGRGVKRLTNEIIEKETEYLKGHVKYFDDLLQGNVYGFNVVDQDDEEIDSCYGFVGDLRDNDNALNMASHISIEGITEEYIVQKIIELVNDDLIIY
jgi:hypothetical protein